MTFRVATYNVLATAYLGKCRYNTPPDLLRPERRVPALTRRIESLGADLLCLQEVEPSIFGVLDAHLRRLGYDGRYEKKAAGRPDGCATFFRRNVFSLSESRRLDYHDADPSIAGPGGAPARASGAVALLLTLAHDGRVLGVANTHLRWDPPRTPPERQVGFREAAELLAECRNWAPRPDAWVICGDFNRTPGSDVPAAFLEEGFLSAHANLPGVVSAVVNGRATLIDFIFAGAGLGAVPLDRPAIADGAVLPSEIEPSDHLPLVADLRWQDAK